MFFFRKKNRNVNDSWLLCVSLYIVKPEDLMVKKKIITSCRLSSQLFRTLFNFEFFFWLSAIPTNQIHLNIQKNHVIISFFFLPLMIMIIIWIENLGKKDFLFLFEFLKFIVHVLCSFYIVINVVKLNKNDNVNEDYQSSGEKKWNKNWLKIKNSHSQKKFDDEKRISWKQNWNAIKQKRWARGKMFCLFFLLLPNLKGFCE